METKLKVSNPAKSYTLLLQVLSFGKPISKDGNPYYRVEYDLLAVEDISSKEWLDIDNLPFEIKPLQINIESEFALKGKLVMENILFVVVDHNLEGKTEYIKDGNILLHEKTKLFVKEVRQASSLRVRKLHEKSIIDNIELQEVIRVLDKVQRLSMLI